MSELFVQGDTPWRSRFFLIWSGQVLSLFGSSLVRFALIWWLTIKTGRATILGIATVVSFAPAIFIGPFAGVIADRISRRFVLVVSDGLIALSTAVLIGIFIAGRESIAAIYIVMFVRATGTAFHAPTMEASTTMLVPDEQLTRIASLNNMAQKIADLSAPPLAALLLVVADVRSILYIDVATAMLAITPLFFLRVPQPDRDNKSRGFLSILSDLRSGLAYSWRTKGIRYMFVTFILGTILVMPAFFLAPLLVKEYFGGGASHLGLFEAIRALTGVIGSLVLVVWRGFRKRIFTSLTGTSIMLVGWIALYVTPSRLFPLGLVATGIIGFGFAIHGAPIRAIFQSVVPRAMQARFFSLNLAMIHLTIVIALAVGGPVADLIGIHSMYLLAVIGGAVFLVLRISIPSIRNIEK